ncbi:unnamed protein product, partial [marine sediment metagenome]
LAVQKEYGISQHQRDEFLEKCVEWAFVILPDI